MNNYSAESIIKKSFLEQIGACEITTPEIMTMLLVVAIFGIYIFFIYRLVCKRTFYSKSFAVSLVAIAIITSIIIMTVKSSIVISLGMVGALSIVRFRTPVKEPMDLAFIFWSIAVGIICGANLYTVAFYGSIMLTIVLMLLHFIPNVQNTLMMVINADASLDESNTLNIINKYTKNYSIRSRNINKDNADLIIEVKINKKKEAEMLKSVANLDSVQNVSLMTHDGEVIF